MYRMHCPMCAETKDHRKMESCTSIILRCETCESLRDPLEELERSRQWQNSHKSELVNLQEIGRILNIHPGHDIAPEIIPRIQNLVRKRAYYHAALMELLCLLRSDGKDPVIQKRAGLLIGDYVTLGKNMEEE